MTILSSELQLFLPTVVSDTSANGGGLSDSVVTSNVLQNVFPNVFKAERDLGSTKHRKVFPKVSNALYDTLFNPLIWLDNETIADDWVTFFVATPTMTEADIVGTERKYGCAPLLADVLTGVLTLDVTVPDASLATGNDAIFLAGDTVRLTNMETPSSVTGTEETLVIDAGGVSVVGSVVTLTFTTALLNDYTSLLSRVMSVYDGADDVVASTVSITPTTAGDGDYDDTTYPVVVDNIAGVDDTFTCTFTDATNFTCVRLSTGLSVGSGTTGVDFAPSNAAWSREFFTLLFSGFSGTWANGDTLVIVTKSATVPVFEKRVVPAGAASLTGNSVTLVFSGESA